MKEIKLTQGQVAKVCDCHYHLVKDYKWHAQLVAANGAYYVAHTSTVAEKRLGAPAKIQMHRLINNTPQGVFTDHKDHDTLNNQCSNLRTATQSQNIMNTRIRSDNTSGIKGVSFHKSRGKYQVHIAVNGKIKHVGSFDTIEEAKHARSEAERKYYGEFST